MRFLQRSGHSTRASAALGSAPVKPNRSALLRLCPPMQLQSWSTSRSRNRTVPDSSQRSPPEQTVQTLRTSMLMPLDGLGRTKASFPSVLVARCSASMSLRRRAVISSLMSLATSPVQALPKTLRDCLSLVLHLECSIPERLVAMAVCRLGGLPSSTIRDAPPRKPFRLPMNRRRP